MPVIGVIGVPDVMRASTAAQQVDRAIGERREKLNSDAQKEQAAWRDLQQALAAHRSTMSPEQIRAKERELQERITNAQRQFRDRNRIIQEAAQVALNEIQSALIAVIRQVSESHGMNLVLHRQQVALNVNDFDITDQVTEQLNKILPTVNISPDGVSPASMAMAASAAPAACRCDPGGCRSPGSATRDAGGAGHPCGAAAGEAVARWSRRRWRGMRGSSGTAARIRSRPSPPPPAPRRRPGR